MHVFYSIYCKIESSEVILPLLYLNMGSPFPIIYIFIYNIDSPTTINFFNTLFMYLMKHLINCTKLVDISMIEIWKTNKANKIESIYPARISIFCRNYLAHDTSKLWLQTSSHLLENYFLDPRICLTCFHGDI